MPLDADDLQALSAKFNPPSVEEPEAVEEVVETVEAEPEAVAETEEATAATDETKTEEAKPTREGERRLLEQLRERESRLDRFKPIGEDDWAIDTAKSFLDFAREEKPDAAKLLTVLETQLGAGVIEDLESQIFEPRLAEYRESVREEIRNAVVKEFFGTELPPSRHELEGIRRDLDAGKYLKAEGEDETDDTVRRARQKEREFSGKLAEVQSAEESKAQADETARQEKAVQEYHEQAAKLFSPIESEAVELLKTLGLTLLPTDTEADVARKERITAQILTDAWLSLPEDGQRMFRQADANLREKNYGRNQQHLPALKRMFLESVRGEYQARVSQFGGERAKQATTRVEPGVNGAAANGQTVDRKALKEFIAGRY